MQTYRLLTMDGGLRAVAMFALALVEAPAEPDSGRISQLERQVEQIVEAEADLRAARSDLPECEVGCLTPTEAVAIAFSTGADQRVEGRFLLDIRGSGASGRDDPERWYFLNSEQDYRVFGSLTLAFEPETMRQLLNPPRVILRDPLEEGDIIVERERPSKRVALNISNMMDKFRNRRLIIDGEMGLEWISYIGTSGREGVRDEGYYQVWVRIASPDQVTILGDDEAE